MSITITVLTTDPVATPSSAGPAGIWHRSAPKPLRSTYRHVDDQPCWQAWQRHLTRRAHKPAARLAPAGQADLLWEIRARVPETTVKVVEALAAGDKRLDVAALAGEWLETPRADALAVAVECVAWARVLPRLAARMTAPLWWRLLNALVADASGAEWRVDAPLDTLLLCGELPLVLAHAFPELEACRALGDAARRTIATAADELWDEGGIVRAPYLDWLRPLVACWTRMRATGEALAGGWCERRVARAFPQVVEQALRLSRADGSQLLRDDQEPWDAHLVTAAVRLSAAKSSRQLASLVREGRKSMRRTPGTPETVLESEAAGLALLRPDWQPSAPRLAIAYHGSQLAAELALERQSLWRGPLQCEVLLNGQTLRTRGNWEQVCWVSDDEVDYLELSLELDQGVTIERHFVLGRVDQFAIVADTVLGIQPSDIEYRLRLPLADGASFVPEAETHEGFLTLGGKPRARAIPLQLAEWRSPQEAGRLRVAAQGLELAHRAQGQSLFAPLFLDLDPKRLRKPLTWRRLTVAQERQVLPSDVAVGYRVQIGGAQWLVYRSLSPPEVRSVLGVNLMHEFLVANFLSTGRIKRLLEIEPA